MVGRRIAFSFLGLLVLDIHVCSENALFVMFRCLNFRARETFDAHHQLGLFSCQKWWIVVSKERHSICEFTMAP